MSTTTSKQESSDNDKICETSSETTTRFLKTLRTSSTIARNYNFNNSKNSKSLVNMTGKITGEMGLQITLAQDGEHRLVLEYHRDRHFQYIHPHVFAPACMSDVRRVGGGGSGIAVFSGTHPELGEIVMKHGGFSDLRELFALSKISSELTTRGGLRTKEYCLRSEAAQSMIACLPEFKMIYISPQHVLLKGKAVWGKLRKLIKIGNMVSRLSLSTLGTEERSSSGSFASLIKKMKEKNDNNLNNPKNSSPSSSSSSLVSLDDSAFLAPGMSIRIFECDSGKATVYLDNDDKQHNKKASLAFVVPKDHIKSSQPTSIELDCSEEFNSLLQIYNGLSPMMTKHLFKFTLAQKRIGGRDAKTGAQWLYEGNLDGLVLANLISKFVRTIRNLQALTLPEEVDVIDKVRREVKKLKSSDVKADGLSAMADQFMGNSIKKNFDPKTGRIQFLRRTSQKFREHLFYLEPEEELPAKHLGTLVGPEASMSDVFVGASTEPPMLHPDKDFWINLMTQAVSARKDMSPNASKQIWTSGLSDAGIHNLFVSNDDLYFFDLGVPQVQSLPGFMTKFLFSFFHALGMQENKENNNEWICRFVPQGDKLALTKETRDLLSESYDAFEVSLNLIIEELFNGDQSIRWLLLQYVTLQLLSDASFCLQRWNMKGGGSPSEEDNHNQGLEQWLWRALWDTYVAFDINTRESWKRLQVEHPSCEESNSFIEEGIRNSICGNNMNPNTLHDLIGTVDEEKVDNNNNNNITEYVSRRHSLDEHLPPTQTIGHLKRASWCTSSVRNMRWPTERLNRSSLRDLTAATFEYRSDDHLPDDSDDDYDDNGSDIIDNRS